MSPSIGFADGSKESGSVSAATLEFFEAKVRPLLANHCLSCHGAEKHKGGLRLDTRDAVLKGGDSGPIIISGDPEKSPMIHAVRYDGETKMPPKEKLPAEAVAILSNWVKLGLPYPESKGGLAVLINSTSIPEVRKTHWSFKPVAKPAVPTPKNKDWIKSPVDAFILAKLEEKKLSPSPAADRRTLLRRVTYDLTGLPPTPEELAAFEADGSPDAYARVVDRLLASPRYGERWGRHWLDVARYADSKGYVFEEERRYPFAYTYRDYVIRSFNEDLPYDQFVREQIAADRLKLGENKRPLAAMGYLTLGRRFLNNKHDIIDDRIDVVMRGLQGLTVTCARCHDHKFDPIPTRDYYSLYGIFANSQEPTDLPLVGQPEASPALTAFEKDLAKLEKELAEYEKKHKTELDAGNQAAKKGRREITNKINRLKSNNPAAPPRAMVLADVTEPHEPYVFLRGNPNNHGDTVPLQYLRILAGENRKPFHDGSGRLDLANAIASKDNPLTARVMVNRLWLHHFGAGLVRTPSDFGLRGEPPTHPELLDYLATSFMDNGWSIKKLHRLIVLSSTYQEVSQVSQSAFEADPENRLYGRMNRLRLDFEELRDSILFVSGRLDLKMGGPAVEIANTTYAPRRTVYGFIDRQNLPGVFRTFDFASPDTTNAQRFTTTVPQQALYFMNNPFIQEQAKILANRPDVVRLPNVGDRVKRLYSIVFNRLPDKEELSKGEEFLKSGSAETMAEYAQILLASNEFVFID